MDIVLDSINEKSSEYGISLSGTLTSPWTQATNSQTAFKDAVDATVAAIKDVVANSTSELTSNLTFPWEELTKDGD